jgi:hypothetical protein
MRSDNVQGIYGSSASVTIDRDRGTDMVSGVYGRSVFNHRTLFIAIAKSYEYFLFRFGY